MVSKGIAAVPGSWPGINAKNATTWVLAKDPAKRTELDSALAALARSLARQAAYLAAFMPFKAEALWTQLGAPDSAGAMLLANAASINATGWRVTKGEGLFPRPEAPTPETGKVG